MLRASLIYVVAVSWQPMLAFAVLRPIGPYDDGIRPATLRHSVFAIAAAMILLAGAVFVETLVAVPRDAARSVATPVGHLVAAFAVVVALLWIQSIASRARSAPPSAAIFGRAAFASSRTSSTAWS